MSERTGRAAQRRRSLASVVSTGVLVALVGGLGSAAPAAAATSADGGLVGALTVAPLPTTVLGETDAVSGAVAVRLGRAAGTAPTRLQGPDRYATAVAVTRRLAPGTVSEVVLVSGSAFPDALTAVPLAARAGGVLLLTAPTSLPGVVRDELARLRPSRVTVIGGTGAVSAAVATRAGQAAGSRAVVRRLHGADRYATARAVAAQFAAGVGGVVVASGESFPDGVSAGPVAAALGGPVLLSPRRGLDPATARALRRLAPARVVVAGGTGVLAPAVVTGAQQATGRTPVRRFGADRYATSASLATYLATLGVPRGAAVATGAAYPDALVGAVLAARARGPVLLVAPRAGGGSRLAATVLRLRGAPRWTTTTADLLARQESLPDPRNQAYDASYRAAVTARLYGWSDAEAGRWVRTVRTLRKADGSYGLNAAWDAFGDGTVNPAGTGYLVTVTDHVGRTLLDGHAAGAVGDAEVGALVDLVMAWPRVNGDPDCLAYSTTVADRKHCVYNVNSSAAWFLRAPADQGVERSGQRALASRLWAHDARLESGGWWPYSSNRLGIRQDWNHNAAMVEWQLLFDPARGQRSLAATMATGLTHPDPAERRYDDAMGFLRVLPFACTRQGGVETAVRTVAAQQRIASDTGQLALWAARVAAACS